MFSKLIMWPSMEHDDVHLLCGKYWIILDGELTEGHAELTAEEK